MTNRFPSAKTSYPVCGSNRFSNNGAGDPGEKAGWIVTLTAMSLVRSVYLEDFPAIPSPARRESPISRDLPLVCPFREVADVDLVPGRFIGHIYNKAPVGRESWRTFVEGGLQENHRLTKTSVRAAFPIE